MSRPLISICIPTYNRCEVLDFVLSQYVNNKEFDEDVELVVSDNASDDGTDTMVRKYTSMYPNIRYFRNRENVKDSNFAIVLDHGMGEYLKLSNDWVFLTEESLRFMKSCVREHLNDRVPLFFTNDYLYTSKKQNIIECKNLDEYIQAVSTFVTCNSIFGVWKEHWEMVEEKIRYTELQLNQVDWSYQIVLNRGCIIYDSKVFEVSPPMSRESRGGYNWFKVHLDNYYRIMTPYVSRGFVSEDTLNQDKLYLLWHFLYQFESAFFKPFRNDHYDYSGTLSLLIKHYTDSPILRKNLFYLFARFFLDIFVRSFRFVIRKVVSFFR